MCCLSATSILNTTVQRHKHTGASDAHVDGIRHMLNEPKPLPLSLRLLSHQPTPTPTPAHIDRHRHTSRSRSRSRSRWQPSPRLAECIKGAAGCAVGCILRSAGVGRGHSNLGLASASADSGRKVRGKKRAQKQKAN